MKTSLNWLEPVLYLGPAALDVECVEAGPGPLNPSTAQASVALVEGGELARRDGPQGLGHRHYQALRVQALPVRGALHPEAQHALGQGRLVLEPELGLHLTKKLI